MAMSTNLTLRLDNFSVVCLTSVFRLRFVAVL
uniref:Uncharacterized protein n=1 Tax=Anguilla anguilla TaxID=7936 RepID=A0A0E9VJC8_ANGAN